MTPTLRLSLLVPALLACGLAAADEPGMHPHYMHGLADLRAAQWQVDHRRPEDGEVQEDELVVSDEISAAMQTVRRAAATDAKDLGFNPPPDTAPGIEGRLHATIDLLRAARGDVALPESDPSARAQQRLSLLHIDAALHAADRAVGAVRRVDERRE